MSSFLKHPQVYFFLILLVSIGIAIQSVIYKIAIFGLLLQWLITQDYKHKILKLKNNRFAVGLMLLYVFYAISFFWSDNRDVAIVDIILKVPVLIFPFIIFSQQILSTRQINQVFFAFSVSSLAINLFCFGDAYFSFINTGQLKEFYYHNLTINMHTAYQAMFTCFSIVIFVYLFIKHKFISNWTTYLFVIIQMIFVLLISSRMQILIMACIVPTYLISYYFIKKNIFAGILYTVLIFMAASFFISQPSSLNHRYKKTTSGIPDPREMIWTAGFSVIKNNWLIGAGIGDAKDLLLEKFAESIIADSILEQKVASKVILIKDDNNLPVYLQANTMDSFNIYKKKRNYVKDSLIKQNNDYAAAFEFKYNFHNQYLQTFAEIGIFGFLLLFYLLYSTFVYSIRNRDYLFSVYLFIVAVSFLTESMLERQAGLTSFAFLYTLFLTRASQNRPS